MSHPFITERQMELWNLYETSFSVPGIAVGKEWFGLQQAMIMEQSNNNNNNTNNNNTTRGSPKMSAALKHALHQHGIHPDTKQQPHQTPQRASATGSSFSALPRPTRLLSSPSADWSYKDIAPTTTMDHYGMTTHSSRENNNPSSADYEWDRDFANMNDNNDDMDAQTLPEPTTLYRESTLMSNVGEPLSPISSRGSRSSQPVPNNHHNHANNNNNNHHLRGLANQQQPPQPHMDPYDFPQDRADPFHMQLPNGSWMSQEQITHLLLKGK